ncbi:hypothetical protein [Dictyobacter kobayashii]|uniref:Uncharacterized protein n=1 Tax=Dictyobacter kobayashii TaxID=2014872 RepID=A0A402AEM7_9CHLR|nr:hypothetical protein [Dictyobacter kobayashii]GCE17568.1 hypothetical protein KDK_13680 [Dictyobacter kobayashii]
MTTTVNPLELIDAELSKASAPRVSKRPVFLFFKENHKALIRPLATLQQCLVFQKHNRFDQEPERRVNAICAAEVGAACVHCAAMAQEKKLAPSMYFYLPIYVYGVVDQKTGEKVCYKEKNEVGEEVEKPLQGVRVLELTSFGTIGAVLKFFREFMKDGENAAITEHDFSITQLGTGQGKTFVVMPKIARPLDSKIQQMTPTAERLRERLLEALPPAVAEGIPLARDKGGEQATQAKQGAGDGSIPEF